MGIFEKLFGKPAGSNVNQNNSANVNGNYMQRQPIGKIDSDNNNTLNLKKEEAIKTLNLRKNTLNTLCLKKSELGNLKARVCVVMDFSDSMKSEYKRGRIQELFERLFPLALRFDDNGELEGWIFSNGFKRLENITENNFFGYVEDKILSEGYRMGGTEYAPVINDVTKKYVKEEPSNIPTYVIFITDGDNSDHEATERAIIIASRHNIFWQFVGIGNSDFEFLENLDEMDGRLIDNANFFECNSVRNFSDEELYSKLLYEFPGWISKAKNAGILK